MIDCNGVLDSLEAVKSLSDEDVLAQTRQLLRLERTVTASALVLIGEMEARGLPPDFDSWNWTNEEPSTYLRAARVLREMPYALELFRRGDYSIASVAEFDVLLAPNLESDTLAHDPEASLEEESPGSTQPCRGGPDRCQLAFTLDRTLYEKLQLARELLSEDGERVPIEEVLMLALDTLFESGFNEPRPRD